MASWGLPGDFRGTSLRLNAIFNSFAYLDEATIESKIISKPPLTPAVVPARCRRPIVAVRRRRLPSLLTAAIGTEKEDKETRAKK